MGPHDLPDSADACGAKEFGRRELAILDPRAQRLQRNLDPEAIAELEAIGHGLYRSVYAKANTIAFVNLDSSGVHHTGEPVQPHGRPVEFGARCPLGQGDADLMGNLRGESVEVKRRDEGDHGLGDTKGHRDEIGLGERWEIGQAVHPAADLLQNAGISQNV